MEFWGAFDEAPALGRCFNAAVEDEEQEEVASADALLVEVSLCDAGLAEQSSPLLPRGTVFSDDGRRRS